MKIFDKSKCYKKFVDYLYNNGIKLIDINNNKLLLNFALYSLYDYIFFK